MINSQQESQVAETLLLNLLKRLQEEALNEKDNIKVLQKSLQIALDISGWDYAATSKLSEDHLHVDLVAFVSPKKTFPQLSYDLLGTPCQSVIQQKNVVCYLDVQQRFTDEKAVQELGIQSYIGMMYYISGEPIGHIYFMSKQKQALQQVTQAESLLQLLSVFIGSRIELIKKHEELAQKQVEATVDALTGTYNRRRFEQDILRVEKQYKNDVLGDAMLLMLDIDGLKQVNDTYGHTAGDEIIRLTSSLILNNFRKEDLTYRLGGDEFAILVLGNTQSMLDNSKYRIERIRKGLHTCEYSNVSVSVGAMLLSEAKFNFSDWLDGADARMYVDKQLKLERISEMT